MTRDTANLTALASFNELARAVENAVNGRFSPAQALQAVEPFEREFLAMVAVFQSEVRFQPDSETLQTELPKVGEAFQWIMTYLPELKAALEHDDMDRSTRLIRRLSRRVTQMVASFDVLKTEEASRPQLSPSRYVNELLRVAYAYLEGKLSGQLLSERLHGLMGHLQSFLNQLEQTPSDPKEAEVLAQHRAEMDEALDEQLEALHEIDEHLRRDDADPEELRLPLETLRETTQSLYELTQKLAEAMLAEEQKHCLRCGQANDRQARFCSGCNAVFPTFNEEAAAPSQVNVRLEEEIVHAGPRELPPLVRQLLTTVEETAKGGDPAALEKELEAAQQRMRTVERMLEQLEDPPEETPEDQLKVFEDTLHTLEEGFAAFNEGLAQVAEFFQHKDSRLLWDALHKLAPAAEQLAAVQSKGNAWIAAAQRQK